VLLYLEQAGEAHRKEEEPKGEAPAAGRAPREAARAVEKAGKGTPGISGERAGTSQPEEEARVTRKPMSRIRLRIAERLLEARRNTAMLTTFNEIDMSAVQNIRARFKERFRERHGVSLGIMSFFIKAVTTALREIPELNAFIDGTDIVYHGDVHLGIAVAGERGLVVPVIRNADRLGFAELERAVVDFVAKVKENRLELSDLEGGTFTITNGGVFGSLLSTPILNTPQSGILGMHKIEDRPVVVDGQVVVRPMMYVALSYDHRIVDGREAVVFLRRVKECVEHPERILLEV
jgi:2-oxoglutarate dehydrogenase E2 component (dihydrolipoamide succinyltransferase)